MLSLCSVTACSVHPCRVATTVNYTTLRRKCCLLPVPPLSSATLDMIFCLWKPLPHLTPPPSTPSPHSWSYVYHISALLETCPEIKPRRSRGGGTNERRKIKVIVGFRDRLPSKFSSSKTNCLPCYLFRWKSLVKFWACHWWICLKNHQHCTCQVLWTRFHSHHALLWKPWHPLADHHESATHLLPLALYHVIWRQPSSNFFWKSHHLTKIFWKTTAPFLTFHFCPKSLKKSFSTNFSCISKKTTQAFQSAYRAGHSTETVLLRLVNDILSVLDNDSTSVLLLLELSATFDITDHQILLSRRNSVLGIQATAFQWFQSYLSDRYQSTSVNNLSSSPSQLMYGVPQGSVLGPILFVLYTTPLSDIDLITL